MRPSKRPRYSNTIRCAATRRLRRRAQDAEARLARLEAERDRALAHMRELRATIAAERAGMTQFIESPTFRRDLLVVAQREVAGELLRLTASEPERVCAHCHGLPEAELCTVLEGQIAALEAFHGLPAVPHHLPHNWPRRVGLNLIDESTHVAEAIYRRPLPPEPAIGPERDAAGLASEASGGAGAHGSEKNGGPRVHFL